MPISAFDPQALQEALDRHLDREGRQWLANLIHDQLGGRITNASIQAEIILRAWSTRPEMALNEMKDLKARLDETSAFLVALVRAVTPPASDQE